MNLRRSSLISTQNDFNSVNIQIDCYKSNNKSPLERALFHSKGGFLFPSRILEWILFCRFTGGGCLIRHFTQLCIKFQ